ncbi:MAG: hypothetical protein H6719_36610, partial [Sandaracinaceae bacterium]|nr:hypothetical protein [Sandaracinaceae bacterium]
MGPDLPENIGQTHSGDRTAGSSRPVEPEVAAEPMAIGTPVWAELRSTGFYFHGVVVDRREEQHRVIFDDGTSEWLTAEALRPDSLAEEARVDVRPTYGGNFSEGVVARRLADVIYVRFPNGDEQWASLAQVRFEEGDEGTPRRGDATVSGR